MHFPFCASKCFYCDFYSSNFSVTLRRDYLRAMRRAINECGERLRIPFETLYLGGGTPTVLSGGELAEIIVLARNAFGEFDEITVEANPGDALRENFTALKKAGVNRVSLGVQSADDGELKRLGRRHTNSQVVKCVEDLRSVGIENISLDLMIGIPGQTPESFSRSIDFCLRLNPSHISTYMLKIEPATPFGKDPPGDIPDDGAVSDLYLYLCERLKSEGYFHYEISNFCLPGFESRHNMKYWTGAPYLGVGAGAHGFLFGHRYYFPRDINAFIGNRKAIDDGFGGGEAEYIMLRLRLAEGISYGEYAGIFHKDFFAEYKSFIMRAQKNGLAKSIKTGFALTDRGFLVQNAILCELI